MAIDGDPDGFDDAWAHALPPHLTGPGKGKDNSKVTPIIAPDSRAQFRRGPLVGMEVSISAARDLTAAVSFLDVFGEVMARPPTDVFFDVLEPLGLAGGDGNGGR